MASASDHIDHVKTQLPYALFTGGITAVIYLILGFVIINSEIMIIIKLFFLHLCSFF